MATLDDKWRSYAEKVLPGGAFEAQRIGTKVAFYGGAAAVLGLIGEAGSDSTLVTLKEIRDAVSRHLDDCVLGKV